ncbi:MAG: TonB-dependent siderophore receptor [Pseudolabrys sp.]|nr:TonB-dependent siderophore receptor [Pseudolabrys sp.]
MNKVVASIAAETVGLPFDIQQVLKSTGQQIPARACDNSFTDDEIAHPANIPFQGNRSLLLTAVGLASLMAAAPATAQDSSGVQLPTIDVTGDQTGSPDNTLQSNTGVSRLGRVQDIPQTVTVINQQTLREQGVTTLDQALRNVPGVTVAIGEGNGGVNGDQFRIRGFQAKGDVYTDGLRDFGTYVRDTFAYEQIQVLKGPSSESFGVGTTGGAINNVMKKAKLGNFTDFEGTLGMGPLYRGVLDVNRQINPTTAVRIVAMGHDQDIEGRDRLFSDRWGVLGSVGLGLGTDTTLTLNYMHQDGRRVPDMGQAIITPTGQTGRPISEFGVNRSNFYGKSTDIDDTSVDMFTARFNKEVNGWLTISNDTRIARYDRYFTQSVTSCPAPACVNAVAAGNQNVAYAFGGPAGYRQVTWGAQNITTGVGKFNTGPLRHELIVGLDLFYQTNNRTDLANSSAKVPGTIAQPSFDATYSILETNSTREASGTTAAVFASDRVWFTDQFSLLGGVRLDRTNSSYQTVTNGVPNATLSAGDTLASPKASAIWEPTKQQTYYLTWARSYSNLAGQFVADPNAIGNATLEPEQNDLWEAGAKINLLGGRLGLTGALFRVTKGNSVQTDPTTGDLVQTNETQRVQGVELGATGKITDAWTVQLAYAYMQSEILSATPANAATVGNRVSFVPEHAASLWTTYDVAPLMSLPGKLLVGGGVFYTGEYFVNSQNTAIIPSSLIYNGLVSYEIGKYRFALNAYNLTDELYYDTAFGNRAVVGAGRTVTLTAGVRW